MCSANELLIPAVLFTVFLGSNQIIAEVYEINLNSTRTNPVPRALISRNDEYVNENQKSCLESRSLVSCIKYKASKILWKFATNNFGFFPNEYGRDLRNDTRRIRIIQMAEPSEIVIYKDFENRSQKDDSAWQGFVKFLNRAAETFGRNHALQISLNDASGARIRNGEVGLEEEGRGKKKLKRWLIILPIIILWKIAHLKMTMVTLLFGVLGLNVLLIGGTAWLIHYLKYKTLCKIHPHLVQSHSHVYDSDPADYSSFVGSSFPGSHYHGYSSGPHEVNIGGYSKDWGRSESNRKAYSGYNYLDTISKRLQ